MSVLHIIDKMHGDKRIQWEGDNKKDIGKIKRILREKLKAGWLAYGFKGDDKTGKQLRGFDPSFDRIVLQRPFAAG